MVWGLDLEKPSGPQGATFKPSAWAQAPSSDHDSQSLQPSVGALPPEAFAAKLKALNFREARRDATMRRTLEAFWGVPLQSVKVGPAEKEGIGRRTKFIVRPAGPLSKRHCGSEVGWYRGIVVEGIVANHVIRARFREHR